MPKKSSTSQPTPSFAGLTIQWGITWSAAVLALIAAFHDKVRAAAERWSETQASRNALVENARGAVLDDTIEHARMLDQEKAEIETEIIELHDERRSVLPRLELDAANWVEKLEADYQREFQTKFDEFVAAGYLVANGGDYEHVRIGLSHRVHQEMPVVRAKAALLHAKDELSAIRAAMQSPASIKTCTLEWGPIRDELVELIFNRTAERKSGSQLSAAAEMIRDETGLKNSALPDKQLAIFEEVVDALGIPKAGSGCRIKFTRLKPAVAQRVANLLRQLPETAARNQAISHCNDYPAKDERIEIPKTHYEGDMSGFAKSIQAAETAS